MKKYQEVMTPCGVGKLVKCEGGILTVEFDWTYFARFSRCECRIIRNKKAKHRKILWWITVGLFLGLTPGLMLLARLERGYFAIGGEVLLPLIPFTALWLKNEIKELIRR